MTILFTNNAVGSLASSITNVATTLTLQTGEGALFPSPGAGEYFYATIISAGNVKEIVKCTSKSSNTLTIVRAQDGTSAVAFDADSRVELRVVAASLNNFVQLDQENTFTVGQNITGNLGVTGEVEVIGAAASDRFIRFWTDSEKRWALGANNDAESSGEAGSNFGIYTFDDDGVIEHNPIYIARATGAVNLKTGAMVNGVLIDALPSATKIIFRQTAAPTGWTKETDTHDSMLRMSNTTLADRYNASRKVTDIFKARTITQAHLPSVNLTGTTGNEIGDHYHNTTIPGGTGSNPGSAGFRTTDVHSTDRTIASSGLVGTHYHSATVALGGSGADFDFIVNYVDVISASKA